MSGTVAGQVNKTREDYERFLQNHPFLNREKFLRKGYKIIPKYDRPDYAREMEIIKTMDPATGQVPWEKKLIAYQQTRALQQKIASGIVPYAGISNVNWVERGPNNVGGRTRALMFDPNDPSKKKVWAGGVTGGIWYNNDITNASSSWNKISDLWESISISCITYDPNNTQIFYIGTGEGFGAGAGRGAGIWKTMDGGNTWTQLSATTNFFYVNDIMVRNEAGLSVIYAAIASEYYEGVWHGVGEGLQRSVDGGTTWAQVLPNISGNPYQPSDIEIGADNRIYIGSKSNSYGNGGGTILYSTTGLSGSWTIVNKYSGVTNVGRIELACAPSNANILYAMVEAGNKVYTCATSKDKGVTWTNHAQPDDADTGIAPTDFSRDQAWYDLILAVDPNNPLRVIAGAIDLFLSADSMGTWAQISKWSNNPNMNTLSCSIVHADQHAISFQPGSSNTVIFGNDGGVSYTSQLNVAASSNVISSRNKGYNVTQFYSSALHPTAGSNLMLAGAQDNGTQRFSNPGMNATVEVNGGDGAFCFIDQDQPQYMIASYVYNDYSRSSDGGSSFPTQLSSNTNGSFINPADYDNRENILYSGRTTTTIQRITNVTGTPTTASVTVTGLGSQASAFACSPYSTPGTSTVFVGTSAGKLFKLTNAHTTPTVTNITGASFPTGYISCIEIGASENELLVTFSNYNVKNIWYTTNGGTTWVSKDEAAYGLPDMPIRWAIFRISDRKQVLVATETGVWSTTDITAANPGWQPTNTGMGNVRCDMLQIRSSDYTVMASAHGRGVFTMNAFSPPDADFYSDKQVTYLSTDITFTDNSVQASSYSWNFGSGAVPATATGAGPHTVQYTTAGKKTVTLTINGGVDVETKTDYIHILPSYSGSYTLAMGGDFESNVNDFAANNVSGTPFERGNSAISGKNSVVSGANAWVTGLSASNYASNTVAYLYTPNFDFSLAGTYTIAFKAKYDFSSDVGYDGYRLEYSTDKGATWLHLSPAVAANWYDRNTATDNTVFPPSTPFFSALITSYSNRTRDISALAGNTNVAFRWVFKSDLSITDVGLAIDDFTLTAPSDITPPTILTLSPPDNATGVAITSNLVMTFSENIQKGTGNILIKENGTTTQTINVTSGSVTISGSTVTIDPSDFTQGAVINIEMPAGIFKDMANNNFAGILISTAWDFCTTPTASTPGSNSPVCEGTNL
ncbi:MAG: Ig-like domain-containing protein, partial [Bacteroidia bacterium]|nr:Ig-like domain-containing protein [Bacteroidia bacterium]